MLYLRLINRFILIGLALLGLSVSNGASAATFLVEFKATDLFSSTDSTAPFWQEPFPSTPLFDFTVEGTFVDSPLPGEVEDTIHFFSEPGSLSSVRNLNLYGWGDAGQHGDILVNPHAQSEIYIVDDPQNGMVGSSIGFFQFFAPLHGADAAVVTLDEYIIEFWNLTNEPNGDYMNVHLVNGDSPNEYQGDMVITEIPPPVPVPAAVWLFGTALVGLVGFGKRSKGQQS
jgi:hypothetical protein